MIIKREKDKVVIDFEKDILVCNENKHGIKFEGEGKTPLELKNAVIISNKVLRTGRLKKELKLQLGLLAFIYLTVKTTEVFTRRK